ncbi:MAG: hypothetical protein DLM63_02085 [Solirubrobacterales bacterium]|nr:MAG: hypothetical protein DLM63_02085 [Solirubrobacterales bacterium]
MRSTAILAGAVASLAVAAPAQAAITEIGDLPNMPAPSCPGVDCTAITRTTGIQTLTAGNRGSYQSPVAQKQQRVVAFTLKLGNPNATEITFFNSHAGGPAEAQLAVIRGGRKQKTLLQVVAVSEVFSLQPWFGQTVQFPLVTSLPIRKGDFIGLTVPTWAPVLAVGQGTSNAWSASRKLCATANVFDQTAQTIPGRLARFGCSFTTARLTFAATLISTP